MAGGLGFGSGTLTRINEYDAYEYLYSILSGEWRQSFNFNGASGNLMGLSYMKSDSTFMKSESYLYDAWGRSRNPSDWTFLNVLAPVITERGFTGHEHLDKFRLINMNGRMYDPVTGRFLNADPVIDNSGGAQGLNSYTYVLNNPLKYTDPSGYIKAAPPEQGVLVNPGWLRYAGYGNYSSQWYCNLKPIETEPEEVTKIILKAYFMTMKQVLMLRVMVLHSLMRK